jgi:hypothetical protein
MAAAAQRELQQAAATTAAGPGSHINAPASPHAGFCKYIRASASSVRTSSPDDTSVPQAGAARSAPPSAAGRAASKSEAGASHCSGYTPAAAASVCRTGVSGATTCTSVRCHSPRHPIT